MNSANWTGRTARTMTDAFGPYARLTVLDEMPPIAFRDRVLYWAVVAAAVAVAVMADLGWLP